MARETRVGLVIGLAFIICFALILARRGQPRQLTEHIPYLVDNGSGVTRQFGGDQRPMGRRGVARPQGGSGRVAPNRDNRVTPGASLSNRTVDGSAKRSVLSEGTVLGDKREASDRLITGGRAVPAPAREAAQSTGRLSPREDLLADLARRRNRQDSSRRGNGSSDASSLTSKSSVSIASLLDRLNSSGALDGHDRPGSDARDLRSTERSRRRGALRSTQYTVKAGDSLSRIARSQYGTASVAVLKSLYAANRKIMSSPDMVRIGDVLTLPPIGDRVASNASRPAKHTSQRAPTGRPTTNRSADRVAANTSTRIIWYQVRPNDRYVSIAREQLGDGGRWQEIFELNKAKFPDPNRIRVGVRIKLPPSGRSGT